MKDVTSLPFPMPAGDGHYKAFSDVYKTETHDVNNIYYEVYFPNNKFTSYLTTLLIIIFRIDQVNNHAQRKKVPFTPSVQHSRNTDTMVQCTQCDKWRLVFSK
jgi:hypothetical protein